MPAILESKIEATHRLQREGRWNMASRYRDARRERFRAEGLTRREARELAWECMVERFGPIDASAAAWPQLVQECPPLLTEFRSQPKLNATWDVIWLTVSFVADHDAVLRRTLDGCDENSAELLWCLRRDLSSSEADRVVEKCEATSDSAYKLMLQNPSNFVRWAEEVLKGSLASSATPTLKGEYAALSHLFLKKLVGALPTLIDSIEWFWPDR